MSKLNEKDISFEQAMQQLEGIVQQLETGEMPLEEALRSFEQGAALIKKCSTVLKEAELKIEKLTSQEDTVQ